MTYRPSPQQNEHLRREFDKVSAGIKYSLPYHKQTKAERDSGIKPTDHRYEPGDIRRYGARPGISYVAETTSAIAAAVEVARFSDAKSVYIPSSSDDSPWCVNKGKALFDDLEIYGDGYSSHIRHVNPSAIDWYYGVIFYTGTYGPGNTLSIHIEDKYNIADTAAGAKTVTCDTAAEAGNYASGDIIIVGSGETYLKSSNTRFAQQEMNEVTDANATTGVITLKYPLSNAYTTNAGSSPVVVKINNGTTHTELAGDTFRVNKRVSIHHLRLTQATTNEVTGAALVDRPFFVLQLGSVWEGKFHNLWIESFNGWTGNMWCRSVISDINLVSHRNVFDLGYGSNHTSLSNVQWHWKDVPAAISIQQSLMFYTEACSNCSFDRFVINGRGWDGTNIMNCGEVANNGRFTNFQIDCPDHSDSNNIFNLVDESATAAYTGMVFDGWRIKTNAIGRWIRMIGNSGYTADRETLFNDIEFIGTDEGTYTSTMFQVQNVTGVNFHNVTVPEGTLYFNNIKTSKISINAASCDLDLNGTNTGSEFDGSIFASISNQQPSGSYGSVIVGSIIRTLCPFAAVGGAIYQQQSNFTATNGVAVEFRSAATIDANSFYFFNCSSADGATMGSAIVAVDSSDNVRILTLATTSASFTTDGQNLKYTNTSGSDLTVLWTSMEIR